MGEIEDDIVLIYFHKKCQICILEVYFKLTKK